MQQVTVISRINHNPIVEIEGVGQVRQIEVAEKMYNLGLIDLKTKLKSRRIALANDIVSIAINTYQLYPRQF